MLVGKGESEIMKTPFTNIRSELLKLEEHELKAGTKIIGKLLFSKPLPVTKDHCTNTTTINKDKQT